MAGQCVTSLAYLVRYFFFFCYTLITRATGHAEEAGDESGKKLINRSIDYDFDFRAYFFSAHAFYVLLDALQSYYTGYEMVFYEARRVSLPLYQVVAFY